MSTRHRTMALVVALGLLAAACGGKETPLEIGFKRVALDLAFKDPDKAAAIPPRKVIQQFIPADIIYLDEDLPDEVKDDLPKKVVPRPQSNVKPCPSADPSATPAEPAFTVPRPPTPGIYSRHNTGTIKIETALGTLPVAYPTTTLWEIRNVEEVGASSYLQPDDQKALYPQAATENTTVNPPKTRFQVYKQLARGSSILDTYQYSNGATGGDYLFLVERVTELQGKKDTFRPTPPIRVVDVNKTEGETENHGGTDRDTGVAMTIQSTIAAREWVDVCGTWFDTYRLTFRETMVDLNKNPPEVSGNEGDPACAPDQPCTEQFNVWNIRFDHGLQIVREEGHYARHTSVGDLPVTLHYDYVSTLDSVDPDPNAKLAAA